MSWIFIVTLSKNVMIYFTCSLMCTINGLLVLPTYWRLQVQSNKPLNRVTNSSLSAYELCSFYLWDIGMDAGITILTREKPSTVKKRIPTKWGRINHILNEDIPNCRCLFVYNIGFIRQNVLQMFITFKNVPMFFY